LLTMKKASFLFFCLFLSTFCFSQDDEYHPLLNEGLSWQIRYFFGFPPMPSGAGHFFLGIDTTIADMNYSQIVGHPMVTLDDSPYPNYAVNSSFTFETDLFIREDIESRKIYMYDIENSSDRLMYDFSLEVGDTLFSQFSEGEFVITQVDTITLLNGEQRKMFHSGLGVPYIESVGGMNGLHEQLWYPLSGGYSLSECMKIGDVLIWGEGGTGSCIGFLSTNNQQSTINSVRLFPNPVTSNLTVSIESRHNLWTYDIIDLFGKSHLQGLIIDSELTVNVVSLSKGIYLIRLRTEKGITTQKKFVKSE